MNNALKQFSLSYLDLINNEFKGLNLTRITDFEEFYYKQVIDSLEPAEKSIFFQKILSGGAVCLDVGFGGGFPLLPLALSYPKQKFIGIEARAKKVLAVQEIARKLNLSNVHVRHLRLEELVIDVPAVITFKAVGEIRTLLSKVCASVPVSAFFYKGPNVFEIENLQVEDLGWKLQETVKIDVQSTEGRYLLCFQNVPHGTLDLSGEKELNKGKKKHVPLSSIAR